MPTHITIIPTRNGNGPVEWRMSHNGKVGGPGNYPEISIPYKMKGDISIKIASPQNITFSNDPIWVQEGINKPTKHVIDPQIGEIQGQNTTVLTFKDYNFGGSKTLTYQLNFNNANSLDPIIQNGGGGTPPGEPIHDYALYGFAILFVAALLGYILLRNKRMKASTPNEPNIRDENG